MRRLILGIALMSLLGAVVCADSADTAKKAGDAKAEKTEMKPAEKADTAAVKAAEKKAEVVTLKSGIRYIDHKVGTGAEAVAGKRIAVHYTVWIDENGKHGKEMDSSRRGGQPYSLVLGAHEVIDGWDLGIVGMKVGGQRELFVPSEYAYGKQGHPAGIPPNTNLVFELELMDAQ